MNRKLIALLCVALMLAISIPSIAVASPTASAPTAATTDTTSSLSAIAGSGITSSPASTSIVSAGAKATYLTMGVISLTPPPHLTTSLWVTEKFVVTGYLKNKDGTRLAAGQYVELWYSTRGALHYFGKVQCTATGAYAFRVYIVGQTLDSQTWILYVKHPGNGLEGYNLKYTFVTGHKMLTKMTNFYVKYFSPSKVLAVAGHLWYWNYNTRTWKPLGGEEVWIYERSPLGQVVYQKTYSTGTFVKLFGFSGFHKVTATAQAFYPGDGQYRAVKSPWASTYVP